MPKPKGSPKTGGRKPGTPNKVTAPVRELAQSHGASAIDALAQLMNDKAQPPQCRIAAATALLDRGYGKPVAHVEQSGPNGGPIQSVSMTPDEFQEIAARIAAEV